MLTFLANLSDTALARLSIVQLDILEDDSGASLKFKALAAELLTALTGEADRRAMLSLVSPGFTS